MLALISGGGSALLCAPAPGLSLAEKQALTGALLASGARISEINLVRKHLSAVKGGQLAAAAYPARLRALLISDVPGDDPAAIASGPTVGEAQGAAAAAAVLARYGIAPAAVLAAGAGVIAPGDARLGRAETEVIAAPGASLAAAAEVARAAGCAVEILGDALEGEAREVGRAQARAALARRGAGPLVLLSGGECTVTQAPGARGVGGPNAEFALAAALELAGAAGIWGIACDTDGVDGAAEVAGAVFGPETLARGAAAGQDPARALAEHDSHGFFAAAQGAVVTGPTLTNVNDFRALLVLPAER